MTATVILVAAAFAYGLLAIIGGIIGYVQAKSQVSLISGSLSGLLLLLSGVLQFYDGTGTFGLWLEVIVTLVLIIVFSIRLAKTRKLMPSILMLAGGAIVLWVTVPFLLATL